MNPTNALTVAPELIAFIEEQALPGTGVEPGRFWRGMADILARFTPRNRELLARRDDLQRRIDGWHDSHRERGFTPDSYRAFLRSIGYLVEEPAPFTIAPGSVDPELSILAGPQLVVPVTNARFLLNAVNARWGSLYDALYGTDAIAGSGKDRADGYDRERGQQVIGWAKSFLDRAVPLAAGRWSDFRGSPEEIILRDPAQYVGRTGEGRIFVHNGLHIEVRFDATHPVGRTDPAGISDIILESALSTIVDLEDSVAAVDARDKVAAYANWLGVMKGTLEADFEKNGSRMTRRMAPDRPFTASDGAPAVLKGRSLLLVRNVGLLMTTPAVLLPDGSLAPEGILDAIVTSLIALHDIRGRGPFSNSRTGSIYIVKPKMHGPEEAAFANDLFDAVEDLLDLPRHSIKIGLMDEERRTSANLAACIEAVKDRIIFINTGFLDRTGDEIHTSMRAGPVVRKGDMKSSAWIAAYENRNVQIGLACGFSGRAQIGKGMWAAPDRMADMLEQKIAHPLSGANTAWVPSPVAATVHATHYHSVDVARRQQEHAAEEVDSLDALLALPLEPARPWSRGEIEEELENNAQSILGYVVRWVDQGIGCSKVPDIHDVGLMEDRATLRISSQHIANWLLHDVCTKDQVEQALRRMAEKVDRQNAGDPLYRPMAGRETESRAYRAAHALIFEGTHQPNGYTEPLLHRFRLAEKAG